MDRRRAYATVNQGGFEGSRAQRWSGAARDGDLPSWPKSPNPTPYEILGLSKATLESQEDLIPLVKRAYRRALLRYHPDKLSLTQGGQREDPSAATKPITSALPTPSFSIDQITTAFTTLLDPRKRAEYDRALQQAQLHPGSKDTLTDASFQTGIDDVDLNDPELIVVDDDVGLANPNRQQSWYRACRCGNPRGFAFDEGDLEEAAADAVADGAVELLVGCQDCSLWIRVHFAVVSDDEDGGGGGG